MAASSYEDLKFHIGHEIVCVGYGAHGDSATPGATYWDNVALECESCGTVLMDFDRFAPQEICGGTGNHDGQQHDSCDECAEHGWWEL